MAKTQRSEVKDMTSHRDDPILNLSTVADVLGKSPQTIGRWVVDGCIPYVEMPNGMRKVRKSTLLEWLKVTRYGTDEDIVERVAKLR